jgi:chromate transporter
MPHSPTLDDLFLSFLRLGATAFGGPAMVAYIGEMAVKRKKWLDQETFTSGVALCQSIPGATAIQSAAYVGLCARGITGALAAYVGFGLPAFVFMVILSSLYSTSRDMVLVAALFSGLQVIVVALVANAVYNFGRASIRHYTDAFLACASAAFFLLKVSPFFVIAGAAVAVLLVAKMEGAASETAPSCRRPRQARALMLLLLVALAGLGVLYLFRPDLFGLALLMLKVDLFAFGGGLASVPLMLQEIVNVRGWMDSRTFMDGIALGQITPGPIVITAAFVGYLLHGLAGATVATVAIFTPSFVLLVASAPFLDTLNRSSLFKKALRGILASFVGLLLSVAISFGLAVPWDWLRVMLALAALAALLRKVNILYVVLAGAPISLILFR